ncbi:hypothetical protein BT96DRAFT_925782 [Gymnopus androsaceus JB14]|uniref:DUF6699 domain-containing protein n=1 Tax=Gymnopus androsaceus JB14 TaxID=1447944 RepID=A0A6A4GXI6_9AGAR|nr:hypothetical protein BT96DRAFT_925782 [Gymnopus androsaceus JB14]
MPALTKHVRFTSINAIYSPIPSTPYAFTTSTTTSVSQSSEGSKHSKRRKHSSKLTTHTRPLPLDIPEPITRIHYLLAFSPYQLPPLTYDLCVHPSIIESYVSPDVLAESATDPPVSSLTIACPYLRWEFSITSTSRKSPYVSILDVIHALYRGLRMPVHPLEYKALPSMEAITNVNEAYFSRCNSIVEKKVRQEEQAKGIKRVDFLMGRNRFLGLSKKSGTSRKSGSMVWELNVS